jgi:hypothetical protein
MSAVKTLPEREKELQSMLTTTIGRAQLRDLKDKYEADRGMPNPIGKSVISFILVHEREKGLIVN